MKEKIREKIKKIVQFILNPRLILCFGIAWLITNGWSYILTALGGVLDIKWMLAAGGAYLAFLWLPISPEKLLTVAIAMLLLKWLFPNDEKTLGILKAMYAKFKLKKADRKLKKQEKKSEQGGEGGNLPQ